MVYVKGTFELPSSADLPAALKRSGFRAARLASSQPAHIFSMELSRWFGSVYLLYTQSNGIYRVWMSASLKGTIAWIPARAMLCELGAKKVPFSCFRRTMGRKNAQQPDQDASHA